MVLSYAKCQNGVNIEYCKSDWPKPTWKCAQYNKYKCTRRVHTVENDVVKTINHNHVADATKLVAKRACIGIKEMAQQVQLTT